jgi:hypothetical protein
MASTGIGQLAKYLRLLEKFPERKRGLCIGDSWFQYPLRSYADIQRLIASPKEFGTKINFVDDSYPGRDADEVIGMIKRWSRLAYTLQQDFEPFDVILLSLGGNDVIGLDFARHLKPAAAATDAVIDWPWNENIPAVARNHIRFDELRETFQTIVKAYHLIVEMRDRFAPDALIITHTYADVTPSSMAYTFLTFRAGPWIWGPATKLGLPAHEQKELTRWLLASFHGLLLEVKSRTNRFTVLDTRLELPNAEKDWDNEIHPRGPGFRHLVAQHWRPAIKHAIA